MTVREMARLQSFDDTFEVLGPRASGGGGRGNKKRNLELPQYSQIGNAVPPLMAAGIGEALLAALNRDIEKLEWNLRPAAGRGAPDSPDLPLRIQTAKSC